MTRDENEQKGTGLGIPGGASTIWIVIGLLMGVVIGMLMFDDAATGIAAGLPIGVIFAMIFRSTAKRTDENDTNDTNDTDEAPDTDAPRENPDDRA
ncbi:MAG TPA: hypothetical protein VI076_02805 [Actinopolymorphaceae bacterium]